jgi:single-stranded DNA-specific DHH superfamily exonuclease
MNMANNERRQIEEHIFEQALAQIMADDRQQDQVIIAAGEHWHEG